VGGVPFTATQLRGLSGAQTDLLTMIATVGIATARDEAAIVGGPVVDRWRDDLRLERLRQETALERAGVSDRVLEARYGLNPEYELTVRHLVILSERWRPAEERAQARARAETALARARSGEPFAELAGEVSEEPGARERGGLLQPGREGSWVDEFWEAANRLDVGEISDVVETEYGFHVLKLEARERVPFAEARGRIAGEVASEIDDHGAWTAQVSEWTDVPADSVDDDVIASDEHVRSTLLAEADRRGISLGEADEARVSREWESRLTGWAGVFGFTPGMNDEEIAEQALRALGATDQNARIAREELRNWGDVLLAAYPVRGPGA
jgi:PPIC-type PPIASE domain